MKLKAIFSIFIIQFIWPAHAFTTVGLTCANNYTCTGDNEFCFIRRDFENPCEKGLCACLPGYILDGAKCTKKLKVSNLGDSCDVANFGHYFGIDNADCYGGVIACNPGYNQRSVNSCMSETTCVDGRLCPGGMYCDSRQRCSCYYDKKFDLATQSCVKRDYGDACRRDTDCQVQGRDFNGFTFRSASCIDGFCSCGEFGQATLVSYLDRTTYTYMTKTICVATSATVNATQGTICTLDPVYWSDIADTVVCNPSYVCYQCPEDYQYPDYGKNFYGKCRKILSGTTNVDATTHEPPPVVHVPTTTANTNPYLSLYSSSITPEIDVIIEYFTTLARRFVTTSTTSTPDYLPSSTTTTMRTSTTTTKSTTTTTPKPETTRTTTEIVTSPLFVRPDNSLSTSDRATAIRTVRTTKLYQDDQDSFVTIPSSSSSKLNTDGQSICSLPLSRQRTGGSRIGGVFFAATPGGSWLPVTKQDYVFAGTQVALVCDSGLIPFGGVSRTVCLLDGKWADAFGQCYQPTTLTTLKLTATTTPAFKQVTVPFQLRSGPLLNCLVPVALNGALATDDSNIVDIHMVRPGSLLTLRCNQGYSVMRGSNESVCLTNGQWWKPLGICLRSWTLEI